MCAKAFESKHVNVCFSFRTTQLLDDVAWRKLRTDQTANDVVCLQSDLSGNTFNMEAQSVWTQWENGREGRKKNKKKNILTFDTFAQR